MKVYKFRVQFDDQEDFLRDIEILPGQTFEDFHKVLLSSIGLSGEELASFYTSNSNWRKQKEITLLDMNMESESSSEEDDESQSKPVLYVMSDSKLKDFIEDPHQRLIYEYDFLDTKVFFIELVKIIATNDPESAFPRCVKSTGQLPKKKPALVPGSSEEEEDGTFVEEEEDEDSLLGDSQDFGSDYGEINEGFEELKF